MLERKIGTLEAFVAAVLGKDARNLWRDSEYDSKYLDDEQFTSKVRRSEQSLEYARNSVAECIESLDHALKAIRYQGE